MGYYEIQVTGKQNVELKLSTDAPLLHCIQAFVKMLNDLGFDVSMQLIEKKE